MITISLDLNSDKALYIQIYEFIKKEILDGRLVYPERLPSSRSFAAYLGVSRSTVDTAYDQLVSEGYIEAKEKRGFFVNEITHLTTINKTDIKTLKKNPEHICSLKYDFNPDAIDTTHFPYSIWKSLGKNQLDIPENFSFCDPMGEPKLREAIAKYLYGSRNISCSPEQIIVGAGLSHLLQMLAILFERNEVIAMEEPGYQSAREVLSQSGFDVLSIPLIDEILDIEYLKQTNATISYVTPSHQYPTGSVMPVQKRQELLQWANEAAGRYIIEDDHDSEFRYVGKPIPALKSIDHNENVIYVGTFSKAISPALRVGYMILPTDLLQKYENICSKFSCPVSKMTQSLLADFILEGYFEKHLNRMRKIYRAKHDFMLMQIEKVFPKEYFSISGDNAGLYIILHYHGSEAYSEIENRAQKNGIGLYSINSYYHKSPATYLNTFLLGFADFNEEDLSTGIDILAKKVFLLP